MEIIQIITDVAKIIITPLMIFIAVMVTRASRRMKLMEYKIYALVYAIQSDLTDNGFTATYEKKLKELMNEYDWLHRNNLKK